ncbi:MAG TPA: adenosylcobalamin-dependent ribonucleoside-diphosphate reductase [Methylocella sp.]|nr:adenosylcobalamin-dependent ribonucleoside-diphosphate reductase [Methylocella sp.]
MNTIPYPPLATAGTMMPPISQQIWDAKYRFKTLDGEPIDLTIEDSWRRTSRALAQAETDPSIWESAFYAALADFRFLPGGRILAGAGTERLVTLFSCFVMGAIPDTLGGIFERLREDALTMQQGGGLGNGFSTLRPKGAPVKSVGADASGPLSFMNVWDTMCETIESAGQRRGAMMGTLRCDHPDIEAFIEAKRQKGKLTNFNLSVLATDPFMAAVDADADWPLVFGGTTYRVIKARALWDKIMRSAYDHADPGVIFIDRINARNNLSYCERIESTNPCGEQPLPPYSACDLGSPNLARLVRDPFSSDARIDEAELAALTATAVRMLDNVIDVSGYPLPQQRQEVLSKRRIGFGIAGLGDALTMCRLPYGSEAAVRQAERWQHVITRAAYLASIDLAIEKSPFPLYDRDAYLAAEFVQTLDADIREKIAEHGIRNSHLISIAPTGTISLLAGNISSGIEPVFDFSYIRKIRQNDGSTREEQVEDYAAALYRQQFGENAALPDYFVSAQTLSPDDHLRMQATLQRHVDTSISKTVNCPESISFEDFKNIYREAYRLGCKGCTAFRPNDITGSVLEITPTSGAASPPAATASQPVNATLEAAPLKRAEKLTGATYKLRWPDSEHAFYVTINDIEIEGRRRPFEVFVNSKDLQHHAWVVGLTRMISAVFRRGGDVRFVAEELQAVFDPRGGTWNNGRYVPSLIAEIGGILERHMTETGFCAVTETTLVSGVPVQNQAPSPNSFCPKCDQPGLVKQEGCLTCRHCGWSKCSG